MRESLERINSIASPIRESISLGVRYFGSSRPARVAGYGFAVGILSALSIAIIAAQQPAGQSTNSTRPISVPAASKGTAAVPAKTITREKKNTILLELIGGQKAALPKLDLPATPGRAEALASAGAAQSAEIGDGIKTPRAFRHCAGGQLFGKHDPGNQLNVPCADFGMR